MNSTSSQPITSTITFANSSVCEGYVPDFERVLASYLVSTLVRLCDLDPASSATGAAHRDDERRTDADTAAAASPPKERCAVCFSGWMGVSVPEGGAILRRQLLDPLHADSLLALTYNADDQCTSVEGCELEEKMPALSSEQPTVRCPAPRASSSE